MPYFIRNVSFLSLTDRSPPTRPVLSLYVFTLLLRNMCSHDSVPFPCFRHRHRQRIIAEYCSSSHAGVPMVVCCLIGSCSVCRSPASRHHPCRCAHGSVPMVVCPWWCAHGGVLLDRMLLGVPFLCFQTSPMQVCP